MANIILSDDYGEYIEVDEVAYVRVGAVLGTPANATVGAGDHLNVEAYEWTYDADNDDEGSNHKTWTAAEYAVAHIDALNNQVAMNLSTPVELFTAPEDGELRVWAPGTNCDLVILVNDLEVLDTDDLDPLGDTSQENAAAVRLAKDDVVTVYNKNGLFDVACKFCPDIYPY